MISWLDHLFRESGLWGLLVLFLGSALEYVFPPFPGDTITLLGGIFAVRGQLPAAAVFLAIMSGSLLGAFCDWAAGRWLSDRLDRRPSSRPILGLLRPGELHAWEERFRRRGAYWLAANRFLPGVRAPIFLAAGLCRLPLSRVLLWGGFSTLLWNLLLFAAGFALGNEAERLEEWVRAYGRAVWIGILALLAVLALRWLWVRRRKRRQT